MRLGTVNNPLHLRSTLCRADFSPLRVSTLKPSDPLFQFSPGLRNHRVRTVTVPKLVARPTPILHQVEVVEFLSEIAISFGSVVAIERSFR